MDKHHFIHHIPLYTYTALQRWFRISVGLFLLFIVGCCIVDIPLAWQWYQKKREYNLQKNKSLQTENETLKKQTLQNDIKKLEEQIAVMRTHQEPIIDRLKAIVQNTQKLTILSVKKNGKTVALEGIGSDMQHITTGLKNIAEQTGYVIRIQSIEKKRIEYVFHAVCK